MFLINRRFVQHCAEETDTCILYLLLRLISLCPVCLSALHNKDSSVALLGDQQPVDNQIQRRSVYDHIIINASHEFHQLCK